MLHFIQQYRSQNDLFLLGFKNAIYLNNFLLLVKQFQNFKSCSIFELIDVELLSCIRISSRRQTTFQQSKHIVQRLCEGPASRSNIFGKSPVVFQIFFWIGGTSYKDCNAMFISDYVDCYMKLFSSNIRFGYNPSKLIIIIMFFYCLPI